MDSIRLSKFTDEGLGLTDADDAAFLRTRKVGPTTRFDFTGVARVSAGFLDALFEGETADGVLARIAGASGAVRVALDDWAARHRAPMPSDAPAPVGEPVSASDLAPAAEARRPRVRVTRPRSAPASPLARPPVSRDRFTPTRLVRRLGDTLRAYIESAYPLSDPTLVQARRRLLETAADGHLLAQEPFIETTTRYALAPHGYDGLGLPPHVAALFARLAASPHDARAADDDDPILHATMYGHQARAFRAFLVEGRDIIVATGTGSGKTECFLVPMLGALYDEACRRPASFERPGVRALVLYPMNALVNDQLARLRRLFGESAVADAFAEQPAGRFPRFGMYTGRTPYAGPRTAARDAERVAPLLEYHLGLDPALRERLRQLGRAPAKDLEAFYAAGEARQRTWQSGRRQGQTHTRHHWERRLHTAPGDRELLTRHEMVHGVGTRPGHSPDVLVTNYSMLEYMLMRPFERPIFAETRRWLAEDGAQLLLVLDEAHMYRGAKGAEVAFLLRRLRARLGIHDRPDKLRVIATSASLGAHEDALSNIRRFAADLVGKRPDDFEAISGTRETPMPRAPADADEADVLAAVDLEALHLAETPETLERCLAPVLTHHGIPSPGPDEPALLRALHRALAGRPVVNQLVHEAAGSARPLGALAERVFPGHPRRREALHALLALGTLARHSPDAPGLVPIRVHGMFRGLHALYACLDPRCAGRQANPGGEAVVGRLFPFPRTNCDACGARVVELASCRACGTPYVLAYAERGGLDRLGFLWGETGGALEQIQLLPVAPRYGERTEAVRVHLRTGFIDRRLDHPDGEVRDLYLSLDGDGRREAAFGRCVMCQPSPASRARIHDFRTRGEPPFTALIEAQFAEQPPQSRDPRLPNHGRKVLVFSDGRQKAARLAPALEHSHARDLFRQVVALAVHALREGLGLSGMQWLYPAVVWLCANRGYDLFPSADETEFHEHLRRARGRSLGDAIRLGQRGALRPTESFARALFSEMTDRYYSLTALALATIEEHADLDPWFASFPAVGLDDDAARVLFRAWVRLHLERRSFRTDGAELRALGEGWAGPVGIDADQPGQLLPNRFRDYLEQVLAEGGRAPEPTEVAAVADWFRQVVRGSDLLSFEGDLYYLQPLGLRLELRLDGSWLRCIDCARIHPEGLADLCPGCCGRLVQAEPAYLDARTGYYRAQVLRAFDDAALEPFGLSAAEHSAQLTGGDGQVKAFNRVEEYELRFQDIPLDGKPPIDVLSCTTTMEVGIDIGALSGVALRNVPPHVANYQQRAGRAGRRGRSIASVVTYAHGTSHDAHFFEHPADIISGDVRPPMVYIENQEVLRRHVHAYLVQRFFHEMVPTDTGSSAYMLFESLGKVEAFLSEDHACSLGRLEAWLTEHAEALEAELRHWVPTHSYGLDEAIEGVDATIASAIPDLSRRLRAVLPVDAFARREALPPLEREVLEQRLDEDLLQTLIGRAVFPRYAFPTDVVTFWVAQDRQRGRPAGKRVFDYAPQRDLQLALTEYAPGRSLTVDKWRFESAALFSPFEPSPGPTLDRRKPYTHCRSCDFVSLDATSAVLTECPVCGSDQISHKAFITPAGFAPDINLRREPDRGQAVTYAGRTDRARLELQDPPDAWHATLYGGRLRVWTGPRRLAMVNKGVGERGFRVCRACGRAEPEYGPGYTRTTLTRAGQPTQHAHPLDRGVICTGAAEGPFYLGHRFPTDALLLRLRVDAPLRLGATAIDGLLSPAARMALTSLVEALALAASRTLQIDEGELSGWWTPVRGGRVDEAQIYLYDLLPGGAGYARAVGDALEGVFDAAERLLDGCDCATSCYRCIRHYANNWIHPALDRHLALALLRHVRTGAVPALDPSARAESLRGMREYLGLRGIPFSVEVAVAGDTVPMVIGGALRMWLDVHHPLVDPDRVPSAARAAAEAAFEPFMPLDAFELVHDLPTAVRRLDLTDGVGQ